MVLPAGTLGRHAWSARLRSSSRLRLSRAVYLSGEMRQVLKDEVERLEHGGSREDATPEAPKVRKGLTVRVCEAPKVCDTRRACTREWLTVRVRDGARVIRTRSLARQTPARGPSGRRSDRCPRSPPTLRPLIRPCSFPDPPPSTRLRDVRRRLLL